MQKLYFNEDGWVCERYPYNIPITENFIEVEDDVYDKTFCCNEYCAWKVEDGVVVERQYEEKPEEEILNELRKQREVECFKVTDKTLWFYTLPEEQKEDVLKWYQEWLDVTETKVIPTKPSWLE